jgi:hypothetical protein
LTWYDHRFSGKKEKIRPRIEPEEEWLIKQVGCASHSSIKNENQNRAAFLRQVTHEIRKELKSERNIKSAINVMAGWKERYLIDLSDGKDYVEIDIPEIDKVIAILLNTNKDNLSDE